MNQAVPDAFCCELSAELDEPLFATALTNEIWLLLEVNRPWPAHIESDHILPPSVHQWLDAQVEAALGAARIQFIRQPERQQTGFTFFVAHVREEEPRLYRFQLTSYNDLLELDLAALLADDGAYSHLLVEEPIYLVCTHGRRDRCCALYGLAIYDTLRSVAGSAAWQVSHVGGHRFAANLLTFPDATYYGRVTVDDLAPLVAARRQGNLYLQKLRGRACYDEVVQAADFYIRRESGLTALDAFHLEILENPEEDLYAITFVEGDGGAHHTVQIRRGLSKKPILASCGKPQTKPVWEYHMLDYQIKEM